MKRFGLTPLLILAAITAAMLVAAKYAANFPGDAELSRFIQRVAPSGDWARAVTRAAYAPWIYGVLAISAIAALRVAGWRAGAAMMVTFFVLMQVEQDMKGFIARPRPPAESAASSMSMAMTTSSGQAAPVSYSMPSGWALLFGATVGLLAALALRNTRGAVRTAYVAGCALVLVAGLAARVTLRAHWPSDVIAGYLLAIAIGLALYELLGTIGQGKGQRAKGRGTQRQEGKGKG